MTNNSKADAQNQKTSSLNRRSFLKNAGMLAATSLFQRSISPAALQAAPSQKKMRVAAIFTEFTYRSHAHVILENFLTPYLFNGKMVHPQMEVVSFFADQMPEGEMSKQVSKDFNIPTYSTIKDALCVGGTDLAVDAVLSIGEHGKYPSTKLGQTMYPRKRFFDEIVAVMKSSKKFVPLFSDKHLSYRWDWAKEMYDTTREFGIPFMAGSSVPLAQRTPALEIPLGSQIDEAVSIHGGGVESYDIHGLEVLQSMVEARKGGETGVAKVQFIEGEEFWKAANTKWPTSLMVAAMEAEANSIKPVKPDWKNINPHGIILDYKDGFRTSMIKIGSDAMRWNFACRLNGDPKIHASHLYVGPWQNRNLFKALSHAIQHHFLNGKPPYPVERNLLTTGILEAAMHSRAQGGIQLDTPHLNIAYEPTDFSAMREMGDSWKIITEETPQPKTVGYMPPSLKGK